MAGLQIKGLVLAVAGAAFAAGPVAAQEAFYQGKTIRVIVGYQAGDSHDQWARTYTRYMGKYIPGNPNFLVQDMPGAGAWVPALNNPRRQTLSCAAAGNASDISRIATVAPVSRCAALRHREAR